MAGASILVCDDEREVAEELAEFLAGTGWQVRLAYAAEEAMALLRGGLRPDVLLTDLRLAEDDGRSLIRFSARLPGERRPRIHAIMTGYVGKDTTVEELGVDALYMKPLDPAQLAEDLQRRLARQPDPDPA